MRSIFAGILILLSASAHAASECQPSQHPPKSSTPVQGLSGTLPAPDYFDALVACNASSSSSGQPSGPSRSVWLDNERRIYADALARSRADVLVVPFQIQGYGLDRIERALMTALLANEIGGAGIGTVADPFLASLALGEGKRRIDRGEIQRLAERLGARIVVVPYAGHDNRRAFTLTIQTLARKDANGSPIETAGQRDWRALPFTNEKTPALVFKDLLPEVLKALPLKIAASTTSTAPGPTRIPSRIDVPPAAFVTAPGKGVSPAAVLALLGALSASGDMRVRERLFERAAVAALRGGDKSPSATFLEVYSLMGLERRPVALARLGGANAPAFEALRGLLNGDLPTARAATAKVTDPFQRLLLQIESRDLETTYLQKERSLPTAGDYLLGAASSSWAPLVNARAGDLDERKFDDAFTIKQIFDEAFPSRDFDARSVVRGSGVAREAVADEIAMDIATGRHARHLVATLEIPGCCKTEELRPTRWDLLWLLTSIAERRIEKRFDDMMNVVGVPEQVMEDLARYEPFFGGHPVLTAIAARAEREIAAASPDDERESWQYRAIRDATAVAWWAQGQGILGLRGTGLLGIPSEKARNFVDGYGYDFPRQASWPVWYIGWREVLDQQQQETDFLMEALAFSRRDPEPLMRLIQPSSTHREGVLASISSRFAGSYAAEGIAAERARLSGTWRPSWNAADPLKMKRQSLAADPLNWFARYSLGKAMLEFGGSFTEVQSTFLEYPGFVPGSGENAIELSNRAYDAGSLLFLRGAPELARPLYEIAANLDTGSDASMSSAVRLHMMDGRYRQAAEGLKRRALRYSSEYAYRDYLSLLHAFGEHEAAWDGFSQIKSSFGLPQAWLAALVGQRMQGLDDNAVRAWLKSPEIRNVRFNTENLPAWYAMIWSSTDARPLPDLGALVEELEGPPVARVHEGGYNTVRPDQFDPRRTEIVSPSVRFGDERVPRKRFPAGMPLKSERAYFADAYAAVGRGDYEAAMTRFIALSEHYSLYGIATSYFAYAASKTGDKLGLEKKLRLGTGLDQLDFDERLAKAFFAASRKELIEARRWLDLAGRSRPNTDRRPVLSEFQYAQACEWLYRDTRDEQIRAMLLAWLKSYQVFQPTHGWAYAMQYTYETDSAERIRALAMARYLEPASKRVRGASKAEVEQATAWFRAHNPFAPKEDFGKSPKVAARG